MKTTLVIYVGLHDSDFLKDLQEETEESLQRKEKVCGQTIALRSFSDSGDVLFEERIQTVKIDDREFGDDCWVYTAIWDVLADEWVPETLWPDLEETSTIAA